MARKKNSKATTKKKTLVKKKTQTKKKKAAAKSAKKTTKKTAKKSIKKSAKKGVKKSTEKPLTPREKKIQGIRERLLNQREQLLSEAESALNQLPGQILFPDMGDQASAEIDRNFMLRLRGREQKLLKKIDSVLELIETGSYGVCESCGCDIEIKRLEARPVTSMCIECKTEQEEEEKLREQ